MKWLTYRNQMWLGILVVGLGHLLSWLTEIPLFLNLAWMFFGALFLFHPVWLESANEKPYTKRYVRLAGAVVILMGLLVHTGGGDDFWYDRIGDALGVDVSRAIIVTGYDDHSGFHGDGTMYAVLEFPDDALETKIASPGGWHVLPLTENLQTLVYGSWGPDAAQGPFIGITMPKVDRGYWYFFDRQGDTAKDNLVLTRGSYNYTIAIYDADADLLYYCEYDT